MRVPVWISVWNERRNISLRQSDMRRHLSAANCILFLFVYFVAHTILHIECLKLSRKCVFLNRLACMWTKVNEFISFAHVTLNGSMVFDAYYRMKKLLQIVRCLEIIFFVFSE